IPDIKGVLVASYSASKSGVKVDMQYLDQAGKSVAKRSFEIPLSSFMDKDYVLLQVKENIVDILSAWKYYYYDPRRLGNINISVKPSVKDLSIMVKPDNIQLKVGKNTLPEGEYTLILTASGYQSIITNISVPGGGNISLSFSLQKYTPQVSPIPMGLVYIDANVKGVPVIIAEGGIFGVTPLLTNLVEGTKNVIFQQTSTTLLKNVQIQVKPNEINYFFVSLDRVGAGVNIYAENGSFVVINRKLEGVVTSGSYSRNLTRGIHTITVFKHGFEVFRTNVNIVSDEKINIKVNLEPKKIPVFIVTPQTKEAVVSYLGKNISTTPYSLRIQHGKEAKIDIIAQEVGFNNTSLTVTPGVRKINSVVQDLSPLYGDLLIITDPIGAIVKIDGRIVGKTELDGLLLRSISARKSFLFIQRDGYKSIKTNVHILPNIQNSLSFKLKEAPIKLFVNTIPVQNVSVYLNEEYYGENDGIINVELGNFVMRLVKRGFKTVYTNVSFPEKVDTVIPLTFQMSPGVSDVELVEYVNSNIVEFEKLVSNEVYLDAYNLIKKVKGEIVSSGYTNYSREVAKLFEFVNKREIEIRSKAEFYILNNEANEALAKVDGLIKVSAYSEGMKLLKDFITKVDQSSLSYTEKNQIVAKLREKYKEIGLLSISSRVSNITMQAEKLVARGEKSAGMALYEDAIKAIDEQKVEFPELEESLLKLRANVLSNFIPLGIDVVSNKVKDTLVAVEELEKRGNYSNAIEILSSAIKEIKLSKLYYLEEIKKLESILTEKHDSLVRRSLEEAQAEKVKLTYEEIKALLKEAIKLAGEGNYEGAVKKYNEALKLIELSEFKDLDIIKKLKDDILEDIKRVEQEREAKEEEKEVKRVYEDIRSMVKEAVRLASIEEYDSAIRKYQEALKIIDLSPYRDRPSIGQLRDSIISDIAKLEEERRVKEEIKIKKLKIQEEIEKRKKELPWWVVMQKAWVGVGFEVNCSGITPVTSGLYLTNLNIPVGGKLHISFLPIMGLSVGGFYNANSFTVSRESAYLSWMALGQIVLRIPIIKQLSLFGAFGSGVGQSINDPFKIRLGQDFILNAGIDLKFSWFGMRLSYDMAFYENFNKNQFGGSFGIILWATEE
ncbi:MAG: PEGA domain-containing protein, partial [Brevinematia bacterium]